MIIDWQKYSSWIIPTFLRKPVLMELIRTLMWQVPGLNSNFTIWEEGAKYKAALNASTIVLQKLIEREFGVLATIEELDGLPTDFLVNVEGTVDEVRLKALIDQYKLAGRSYVFKLGTVVFSAAWTNYQCEDITTVYTATFSDYVCEDTGVITIMPSIYKNLTTGWVVRLEASSAVMSGLTITVRVAGMDENNNNVVVGFFDISMLSGTSEVEETVIDDEIAYHSMVVVITNITPASDGYYSYEG